MSRVYFVIHDVYWQPHCAGAAEAPLIRLDIPQVVMMTPSEYRNGDVLREVDVRAAVTALAKQGFGNKGTWMPQFDEVDLWHCEWLPGAGMLSGVHGGGAPQVLATAHHMPVRRWSTSIRLPELPPPLEVPPEPVPQLAPVADPAVGPVEGVSYGNDRYYRVQLVAVLRCRH